MRYRFLRFLPSRWDLAVSLSGEAPDMAQRAIRFSETDKGMPQLEARRAVPLTHSGAHPQFFVNRGRIALENGGSREGSPIGPNPILIFFVAVSG